MVEIILQCGHKMGDDGMESYYSPAIQITLGIKQARFVAEALQQWLHAAAEKLAVETTEDEWNDLLDANDFPLIETAINDLTMAEHMLEQYRDQERKFHGMNIRNLQEKYGADPHDHGY